MKRISKTSSLPGKKTVIYLKAPTPGSGRARFGIVRRHSDGKCETLQSEALEAINQSYLEKKITVEQARLLVKEIVDQLRPQKTAVLHNQANLKILEDYWKAEYEERDNVDQFSAKRRLVRAVEACGHYSLLSASRNELHTEINSKFSGNKQRRIIDALNQLLKWLKRDVKLKRSREEMREVRHLTMAEMPILLQQIEDEELKLLYATAFATGLRLGELFAMKPQDIRGVHLLVTSQIDRKGIKRHTKNRKERDAFILKEYRDYVKKWAEVADKQKLRNLEFSKITRRLSEKALGRSLTFHDLRHSYATHMVSNGISLALVAQCLGDTIAVVEKYYSGFRPTTEGISHIEARLG